MSSQHHVIIGAGPAGVTAAETIRKQDPFAEVTLISGEAEPPYSRMAIPYLLEGKIGEDGTHLRQTEGHYDTHSINVQPGPVTKVDTAAHSVTLANGTSLNYDKLLIATGASPIRPPIKGLDQAGVHTCWTLDDARQITKLAEKGAPVVLVGAGFIGSIILESLAKAGVQLTVVEMGDRMVPRMLDETAGNMLKRWCESQGVRVVTGTTVEAIESAAGDAGLQVALGNGEKLGARLVVVATGVRSNTGFLDGSGIDVGNGIKVDEFLATSAPGVYAAGDVAEGVDLSTGMPDMLAIQPVAVEHGFLAAMNMTGRPAKHRGSLNMNVLDTLGLISSSFGNWQGVDGGQSVSKVDDAGYRYLRLEFGGDKLVGAQCVGVTDHIGMLRGLIQTGLPLGVWKERLMEAPERLPEAYVAVAQGGPGQGWTAPKVALPA
jgi:NADPH-dependent 2,4-dienoyl-CoA reductase/sulfur reductase-like enzyme